MISGDIGINSVVRWALAVWVLLPYLYVIYLDYKHREIVYYKVLAATLNNMIVISVCVVLETGWKVSLFALAAIPVFIGLSVLNGFKNRETVVGQADVDVFICQTLISSIPVFAFFNEEGRGAFYAAMNASIVLQYVLTAIFLGLAVTVVIWFIFVTIKKLVTKKGFIETVKANRNVPTLVAFVPWVVLNIGLIVLG